MALRITHTLICDEVRIEISGKFIIIGMYTGPIGIPQIPYQFPLTFAPLIESDRPGRFSAKIRVEHLESGRRLVEGQAQIQVLQPGTVLTPLKVPMAIERDGAHNFIVELEGEKEPVIIPFTVTIARPQMFPGVMPPGMMPPMMPRM